VKEQRALTPQPGPGLSFNDLPRDHVDGVSSVLLQSAIESTFLVFSERALLGGFLRDAVPDFLHESNALVDAQSVDPRAFMVGDIE
jgi:hypothetical protein